MPYRPADQRSHFLQKNSGERQMPGLFKHLLLHVAPYDYEYPEYGSGNLLRHVGNYLPQHLHLQLYADICCICVSQNNNQHRPRCPLPTGPYIPGHFVVTYAHSTGRHFHCPYRTRLLSRVFFVAFDTHANGQMIFSFAKRPERLRGFIEPESDYIACGNREQCT